jgi:hypothetical protein
MVGGWVIALRADRYLGSEDQRKAEGLTEGAIWSKVSVVTDTKCGGFFIPIRIRFTDPKAISCGTSASCRGVIVESQKFGGILDRHTTPSSIAITGAGF